MKLTRRLSLTVPVVVIYLFIPLQGYGPQLEIYALDVGQGDSILIVTPDKTRILVDGGGNGAVIEQLDKVVPFWDREINLVMLTHPDADHVTGLIDVLQRYKVDRVAITPLQIHTEIYEAFLEEVKRWDVKVGWFMRGSHITTTDGLKINGLWPTKSSLGLGGTNENSQVALLSFGQFKGLFTGDIDTEVATQLEELGDLGDINYLKVPHHGSKYGLSPEQVAKLSPEVSTISVGENNRYGHPSREALASLQRARSEIFRTDKDHLIAIKVDGSGISVISE